MTSSDPIATALRMLPYGFHAVTSRHADDENAMVLNWLTQVSFEPRMVAIGLSRTAYSHGLIKQSGMFAVNVFSAANQDAIKGLTKGRAKNPDKMAQTHYTHSEALGLPVIDGAAAVMECRVRQWVETGGDHDVVIADVVSAQVFSKHEPSEGLSLPDLGWSYAG